jgi:hypothetical protein
MYKGQIVGTMPAQGANIEHIGNLMLGIERDADTNERTE